ncbi:hypothetical protein ZHAS_00014481 [Anopheles sinensis]|uniref:Uncharacterized protein n=1 Tax=Anopheles sinensis TaxID=74873 RepID=A0A084W8E8_ANOSI|nr:hypothetical protein ZHAS_00014481 [Anopheles sinensis]
MAEGVKQFSAADEMPMKAACVAENGKKEPPTPHTFTDNTVINEPERRVSIAWEIVDHLCRNSILSATLTTVSAASILKLILQTVGYGKGGPWRLGNYHHPFYIKLAEKYTYHAWLNEALYPCECF